MLSPLRTKLHSLRTVCAWYFIQGLPMNLTWIMRLNYIVVVVRQVVCVFWLSRNWWASDISYALSNTGSSSVYFSSTFRLKHMTYYHWLCLTRCYGWPLFINISFVYDRYVFSFKISLLSDTYIPWQILIKLEVIIISVVFLFHWWVKLLAALLFFISKFVVETIISWRHLDYCFVAIVYKLFGPFSDIKNNTTGSSRRRRYHTCISSWNSLCFWDQVIWIAHHSWWAISL